MSDLKRDFEGTGKDWSPPIISNNGSPVSRDIKVVCSWCGKHMGGNTTAEIVSHGICADCLQKELDKVGEQSSNVRN